MERICLCPMRLNPVCKRDRIRVVHGHPVALKLRPIHSKLLHVPQSRAEVKPPVLDRVAAAPNPAIGERIGGFLCDIANQILRQRRLRVKRHRDDLQPVPLFRREFLDQQRIRRQLNPRANLEPMGIINSVWISGCSSGSPRTILANCGLYHPPNEQQIFLKLHRISAPLFQDRRVRTAGVTTKIAMIGDVVFERPRLHPSAHDWVGISILRQGQTIA